MLLLVELGRLNPREPDVIQQFRRKLRLTGKKYATGPITCSTGIHLAIQYGTNRDLTVAIVPLAPER